MIGVEFVASEDFLRDVAILKEFRKYVNFDFLIIPDNPFFLSSPSSLLCAKMLQDSLGVVAYPCISGRGKSIENVISWLKGAKYGGIEGIACVSGDGEGWGCSVEEILTCAKGFKEVITTSNFWEKKKECGATRGISQPNFTPPLLAEKEGVMPSFMPIFSSQTFSKLQNIPIPPEYQRSQNLMQSNKLLWREFIKDDFYLIPFNLNKQLKYFKELVL